MKRILILLFSFLLLAGSLYGQSKKAYITAAEHAFMQQDYYSALVYYLDASEFDTTDVAVQYKIAESARLFDAYVIAEEKYQNVMQSDGNVSYPESTFWLAEMKQKLGKYEEAKELYSLYLSENAGDDSYLSDKAAKEIKATEWAIEMMDYPDESITITRLGDGINTEYSEFGALATEDGFYYSSMKYPDPEPESKPGKVISKIHKSDDLAVGNVINGSSATSTLHEAHTTFNADKTKMFYTVCKYLNGSEINCKIYEKSVGADGKFGAGTILPESINAISGTNTQPHVAFLPTLNQEVLFFASDREGGKGKLDIYYVPITNGRYGTVVNMESLNTIENEVTPFYHDPTQTLYFSSDGYQRIGGYDVYKSEIVKGDFFAPDQIGMPINTSFNDLYFTLSDDGKTAYFSSNRLDSKYIDATKEACCYDIYKADIAEVILDLNALTYNKRKNESLSGATVKLIDTRLDTVIAEFTNDEGNDHLFGLKRDRDYIVIGEKEGYKSDTIMLTTNRLSKSQEIIKKLFLESEMVFFDYSVFDKKTGEALDSVQIKIIDLTDGSSKDTIIYSDGNKLEFMLDPGKSYRFEVSKEGYKTNAFTVDTSDGLVDISDKLYLEKKDLNIYLPLTLYFDNDRPNRRTYVPITKKTYTDTYHPYYGRKETFKSKVGVTLSGETRIVEEQSMEDFFEFDVRGGFEKLSLFQNALEAKLVSGQSFEIQIKGYASPRSTKAYNKVLSQRRVMSVMNELNKYKDGYFDQYITSGQLIITDVSFGEEEAPSNVSSSLKDEKESIYSIEASRERRVEIIKIRSLFE